MLSVAFEKELFDKFVDENMKKGLTSNYNKPRYLFVCKRPIPRCLRRIGGIKSDNCGELTDDRENRNCTEIAKDAFQK